MKKAWVLIVALTILIAAAIVIPRLRAGEVSSQPGYQVLVPIRHGNLTIFPVVAARSHDTSAFLTLDEGLRSGEVIVTEAGSLAPLVRPRHPGTVWQERRNDGAEVNRLVLVNNSKRPLLLLAGEIVTGGKQDRIIGKDRLVPAESDPVDLSVFCVEPGRWVETSGKFSAPVSNSFIGGLVQPSIRLKAMDAKNQQQVWEEVHNAQGLAAKALPPPAQAQVETTTSYARVMQNAEVEKQVDKVAAPVQEEYQSVIGKLRDKNAVGVVVAVNGEIIWADVFASTQLLEKYWPKLVRSYAAESAFQKTTSASATQKAAQDFLDQLQGRREVVENEPGLYRHTEVSGEGFKVFELDSLLPGTGFELHLAKMAD